MKVTITINEVVMLQAVKTMRRIAKSKASDKNKETAMTTVFWQMMRIVDEMEGE